MDPLKEAFTKIRKDMELIRESVIYLTDEIKLLKSGLSSLEFMLKENETPISSYYSNLPIYYPSNLLLFPSKELLNHIKTDKSIGSNSHFFENLNYPQKDTKTPHKTDQQTIIFEIPTNNLALEALYSQNISFSSGNEGVQTNKQTNLLTDSQTDNIPYNYLKTNLPSDNLTILSKDTNPTLSTTLEEIDKANKILSSLDKIKLDLKSKFKSLTTQEMLVFSTIYSFQEQNNHEISYPLIAKSLNLTESSIRDYINKLLKKGIPLEKKKVNNKKILVSISNNLTSIASLNTILGLRTL